MNSSDYESIVAIRPDYAATDGCIIRAKLEHQRRQQTLLDSCRLAHTPSAICLLRQKVLQCFEESGWTCPPHDSIITVRDEDLQQMVNRPAWRICSTVWLTSSGLYQIKSRRWGLPDEAATRDIIVRWLASHVPANHIDDLVKRLDQYAQ